MQRARFVAATIVVWAGLYYLVGTYILPPGLDRPVVLVNSHHGPLAGLLVVFAVWLAAAIAILIAGIGDGRRPLVVIGLALALWAYQGGMRGGTMDSWLILQNVEPGPPAGGAYWPLLADYLYLLLAIGGACLITWLPAGWNRPQPAIPPRDSAPRPKGTRTAQTDGLIALGTTVIVAAVAISILSGPAAADTWRGQVYFAVGVGFFAGVWAASKAVARLDIRWIVPAPLLLGLMGIVVAGVSPALALPAGHDQLDMIPAWALARPLPVEMVGVGLVALLAFLPTSENEREID